MRLCSELRDGKALVFQPLMRTMTLNELNKRPSESPREHKRPCKMRFIRIMSTRLLIKKNGHGKTPSCLTAIEQREGKSSHVHVHTVPCFWGERCPL